MAQRRIGRRLLIRPPGIDYTGFVKLRNDLNRRIEAVRCQACLTVIRAPRERNLNRHRLSCRGRDPVENWDEDDEDYIDVDEVLANDDMPMEVDDEAHQQEGRQPLPQHGEDDIARMKLELDIAIGKFFFAEGIAFRKINSPYFKHMIHLVGQQNVPDYQPPERRTLAGPILNFVHDEIVAERFADFDGTESTLLVDGWRNKSSKRKILNFTIRNRKKNQDFLIAYDISHEKEDGNTLARYINLAIQFAKDRLNTTIVAVISDNDNKIKRGVELARNVNGEKLIPVTCSRYSGNLLMKSLVPATLVTNSRLIANECSEPKIVAKIRELGGTLIKKLP
ncbi:hypothetical protein QAD02_007934 [Eretmocerus hayati]|uniref:Uncharacterized protein n=1 Tax=Eretmocerus hayati TaxID=131215 RepID=A0ACC2N518_9HYME|nr:hypothetical protein QAD02_007934 [Eretmocerus hayati]